MKKIVEAEHEDKIWAAREFIRGLEKVQEEQYEKLLKEIGYDKEEGFELALFDYIYNYEGDDLGFEEYLVFCGIIKLEDVL